MRSWSRWVIGGALGAALLLYQSYAPPLHRTRLAPAAAGWEHLAAAAVSQPAPATSQRTADASEPVAAPVATAAAIHPVAKSVATVPPPLESPPPPPPRRSPPPPPPPPPPVGTPPPELCTERWCTKKLPTIEPPWVNLAFQPRINWKKGGMRGDCVVGEYDYIMPAYCSPPDSPASRATALGGAWPSESRLNAADVHTQHLPQSDLGEIVRLLPNRTLLVVGDSVMEQFYNALQCFLGRERLGRSSECNSRRSGCGRDVTPDHMFRSYIQNTRHLWMVGKRKMAPKLPQQAHNGFRMLFERAVRYEPPDLDAAIATSDVIIVNWGLHYKNMTEYSEHLHAALTKLEAHAAKPGHAVLFQETGAQHFKASDKRGYGHGEWERRDKSTDTDCSCSPIEDYGVNRQNGALRDVLGSGRYPHVKLLPFYALTQPRWRWHFGNCTHRPNGWNYDTCCDCTHFCFTPGLWRAHMHDVVRALEAGGASAARGHVSLVEESQLRAIEAKRDLRRTVAGLMNAAGRAG